MLPFFQTCSDKSIKKYRCIEEVEAEALVDSTSISFKNLDYKTNITTEKKVIENNYTKENETCLERAKSEYTVNAYYVVFKNFNEFETRYFLDKTFYIFLIFNIIIAFTILMLIFAVMENIKKVLIFSYINLILAIIWFISLFLFGIIEELNQIKYGYYLFVLNSILIIIESRNELNKQTEQ